MTEWKRSFPQTKLFAIEPNRDSAEICRANNLNVVECFVEDARDLYANIDLVVAQEVIEHVHDPLLEKGKIPVRIHGKRKDSHLFRHLCGKGRGLNEGQEYKYEYGLKYPGKFLDHLSP